MTSEQPLSQSQIIHNHLVRLTTENQQLRKEIVALKEKLLHSETPNQKQYWKEVFEHLKKSKAPEFSTV